MGNRLRSNIKIMITASEHPHDTYAPLRSNAAETATYIAANTIFRKLFGIDQYRSQSTESLSLVYDRYGSSAEIIVHFSWPAAFATIAEVHAHPVQSSQNGHIQPFAKDNCCGKFE